MQVAWKPSWERAREAALSKGELVVVVDDEDRANEGDLMLAAKHATTETNAIVQ
jgi:3,4-dihydroxy-2-butanone 4-phosphate synthase